jgi:hypothetical protein
MWTNSLSATDPTGSMDIFRQQENRIFVDGSERRRKQAKRQLSLTTTTTTISDCSTSTAPSLDSMPTHHDVDDEMADLARQSPVRFSQRAATSSTGYSLLSGDDLDDIDSSLERQKKGRKRDRIRRALSKPSRYLLKGISISYSYPVDDRFVAPVMF